MKKTIINVNVMTRKEERKKAAFEHNLGTVSREMFELGAEWADKTTIEKAISKCALMLLNIDELLRKKGLKGQFEEEFDNEYKKFKQAMEE